MRSSPYLSVGLHKKIFDIREKYGRTCRFRTFNRVYFSSTDPHVLKLILSDRTNFMSKFRGYDLLKPWLGDGLILGSGKKWHDHRKVITPGFHFSALEQFLEIFDRQSRVMIAHFSALCDGRLVDIHPFASRMALDIICESSMGVQVNAQMNDESEYVKGLFE